MACIVKVCNGAHAGRSIWLRDGQTVQFGRTDLADCCIDGDESMSRLHFAIDFHQGVCRIRDLGSRNGTYVNDQPIRIHSLKDGDRLVAGKTEFVVAMESAAKPTPDLVEAPTREPKKTDSWNAERLWAKRVKSGQPAPHQSGVDLTMDFGEDLAEYSSGAVAAANGTSVGADDPETYFREPDVLGTSVAEPADEAAYWLVPWPDGISALACSPSRFRPLQLGRKWLNNSGARLLINIKHMDAEAQSFFASPVHGSKFLRVTPSLVLVTREDGIDMLELFRRGWGRDASIGIISHQTTGKIRDHLHSFSSEFSSPSRLWAELGRRDSKTQRRLLGPIDAVLIEDNGNHEWTILVVDDSKLSWKSLGFAQPPLSARAI